MVSARKLFLQNKNLEIEGKYKLNLCKSEKAMVAN